MIEIGSEYSYNNGKAFVQNKSFFKTFSNKELKVGYRPKSTRGTTARHKELVSLLSECGFETEKTVNIGKAKHRMDGYRVRGKIRAEIELGVDHWACYKILRHRAFCNEGVAKVLWIITYDKSVPKCYNNPKNKTVSCCQKLQKFLEEEGKQQNIMFPIYIIGIKCRDT